MMFKGLPLAILVSFLSASCFANLPKGCQKPDNAIDFNIGQLHKTTWFAQRYINVGEQFPYDCTRAEYAYRMNKKTIFKSFIYFIKTNGDFTNDFYELSQSSPDHFILQDLKKTSMVHHAHVIRYDDFFVEHFCFTENEELKVQGVVVWSKDGKADKKTLDQVVKDAEIKVTDTFEVYQGKDCFKYDKKD